jgi:EAL domain-containing protein (putative c-di-GMP-specific phosphodiesterase class I)/DICT domain-containing protein
MQLEYATGPRSELDAVIEHGIRAVYQPIVDLDSGDVVAYEALARGPADSSWESPAALFAAAGDQGRLADLDRACCAAALRGAEQAGLRSPRALFVNIEPEVIDVELDGASRASLLALRDRLHIFFEVTERELTSRPAQLLETVERMRAGGFGIALDDVGADRRSLALLPLLRPDVVKLDLSLIHNHPSRRSGEVMNGVCAYAEQTGATILAEGVETEKHVLAARSLGATLAQGWYFGRPGPLPSASRAHCSEVRRVRSTHALTSSPVSLVHTRRDLRLGRKDILLSVTRALEAQALELGEHAVVAASFQDVRHFTPKSRARYEQLAAHTSLTVALGTGMPDSPGVGIRGANLSPDDELVGEWDIAVLGPHYAGALVARDLGDTGPDHERRFEFVLTFERQLVIEVVATLIARLSGSPRPALSLAV